MKSKRNILIAFMLNLIFSVLELFGGLIIGSVAIVSDAVHDAYDALSIGLSYICEMKSAKKPDEIYTYGYGRYSVLGAMISTLILLFGSSAVVVSSVRRIFSPVNINYNGMILLSLMGVLVNSFAAYFTHEKESLNEKAVNLHMLEDVLGWITVLLGSVIMRFTDTHVIDPLMSVGIAVFISVNAILNLKKILSVFLEKAPQGLDSSKVKKVLKNTSGVIDIHHIHLWSIDGCNTLATMHVVTVTPDLEIKKRIRAALKELGISHVTVELESENEHCYEAECHVHHIEKSYHIHSH